MEVIQELLPGIDEFLTKTLASEHLSANAEERRLFFVERLDIVQLPPTLPPREGRVIPPELLKETEEKSGIKVSHSSSDFAATQREIARSWAESNDDEDEEKTKVYDDIDLTMESVVGENHVHLRPASQHSDNSFAISPVMLKADGHAKDKAEDEENDLYEIPVQRLQEENGTSHSGDASNSFAAVSFEEIPQDVVDAGPIPPPVPPPLPPRRDIRFSDSGSRNSINGVEVKPPMLPFRPRLPKPHQMHSRSDLFHGSDKSDASGDGGSTSYESFDENNEHGVKLPRKVKKKSQKKSKKMQKSRSTSQWEIAVPFRKLDNVNISGELHHRGKLSWSKRIVALSSGCLALYKPDKEARPLVVIPLLGYEATVSEREGKSKGFEIKLTHPCDDSHTFSVDFKEWGQLWKEHINGASRGSTLPRYHAHLARSFTGDMEPGAPNAGSKTDITGSNSNISTGSEGVGIAEDGVTMRTRPKAKIMRMGSFAFRATQFFETISKKTGSKKRHSASSQILGDSYPNRSSGSTTEYNKDAENGILEESSVSSNSTGNLHNMLLTPTSDASLPSVFGDGLSPSPQPDTPNSLRESPLAAFLGKLSERHFGSGEDLKDSEGSGCEKEGVSLEEEEEDERLRNASHKGFLVIFSTFNRRRWGQRWCVVRENMFECYHSKTSRECELNFLLKPCELRRAVDETGSEFGLMILEKGREKITVEPVSRSEMFGWVQVLMAETTTPEVPSGLDEFMVTLGHRNSDAHSVLSFSVLKKWDMDPLSFKSALSFHDYEDPTEVSPSSPSPSPSPGDDINNTTLEFEGTDSCSRDSTLKFKVEKEPESPYDEICHVEESVANAEVPEAEQLEVKLPRLMDNLAYNKHKNTTDSGFYSVKGANSDSDSECENSCGKDACEVDCGYSTLNKRRHRRKHKHSMSRDRNSVPTQVDGSSESKVDQSRESTPINPDESSTEVHGFPKETDCQASKEHAVSTAFCVLKPQSETQSLRVSPHSSTSSSSSPSPLLPHRKITASPIRQLLTTSSSSSSQMTSSHSEVITSNTLEAKTQSHSLPSSPLEVPPSVHIQAGGDEYSQVVRSSERPTAKSNSSVQSHQDNQNEEASTTDIPSHLSSANNQEGNTEHIPDISVDYQNTPDNQSPGENGSVSTVTCIPCPEPYYEPVGQVLEAVASLRAVTSGQSSGVTVVANVDDSGHVINVQEQYSDHSGQHHPPSQSSGSPKKHTLSIITPPVTDGCNKDAESPSTPTSESVQLLLNSPTTTEKDMIKAVQRLKEKKTDVKRKRMAVHNKRQRVASDEERLACEKEFAALQRLGETTDSDIGILQKELDTLYGHSIESINIHNKKNGGSLKLTEKS